MRHTGITFTKQVALKFSHPPNSASSNPPKKPTPSPSSRTKPFTTVPPTSLPPPAPLAPPSSVKSPMPNPLSLFPSSGRLLRRALLWHRHSCLCSWVSFFLICHPDRTGRYFLAHRGLVRRPRSGGTVAIYEPAPTARSIQPLFSASSASQRSLR